jgi:DNA (cytosine-5)-methyltransferase 1
VIAHTLIQVTIEDYTAPSQAARARALRAGARPTSVKAGPRVGAKGSVGVKLVRGPFISLPPHDRHVISADALRELCAQMRSEEPGRLLAADLFSGAGGLSLGLAHAGIDVVLGVDHYKEAVETHAHHFPGVSVDWDLADAEVVERVVDLMVRSGIDVLCGGPPCQPFSKAGRSKIRHRVRIGERDPHDQRRDLWRSFVEVVKLAKPRAVIMENVPDMALDREMFIFRSVVQELEAAGYSVYAKIVDTSNYGVPQFRQRLIIVALANGIRFSWPEGVSEQVSLWNAIGDLPEVEGGWRPKGGAAGWIPYDSLPRTWFQKAMRKGVPAADRGKLYDHITRPVRADDAEAFALMDSNTKYSDLPDALKRYRDDIFDDKYKRLDEEALSRTITAHIAKDGYWYIHPRQPRTLTVREAARIQTFPDWYRFSGGPTAAFKQIGNAVPPMLGQHLASAVVASLAAGKDAVWSSAAVADQIAAWFDGLETLSMPWLRGGTRWQVLVAAVLLARSGPGQVRDAWPIIKCWSAPSDTLGQVAELESFGRVLGRVGQARRVRELMAEFALAPEMLDDDSAITRLRGLPQNISELCVLAVPPKDEVEGEQPVIATQASLRVAARFFGQPVDRKNRLTDGRLALARMVGYGESSRSAQLGVLEIANTLCRPADTSCVSCPLVDFCVEAKRRIGSVTPSEDVI